jgi:hypothetical protein
VLGKLPQELLASLVARPRAEAAAQAESVGKRGLSIAGLPTELAALEGHWRPLPGWPRDLLTVRSRRLPLQHSASPLLS